MIFDSILARLAPYECLGCGAEGQLLCPACMPGLVPLPSRCYRCRRITEEYKTCAACRKQTVLYSVQPRAQYDGLAKALVWKLKFGGAQAAATEMARLMKERISMTGVLLIPVPTATSRVRRRGYDQSVLLARAIAREAGTTTLTCLRRSGQNEQVGADRRRRVMQLQGAYHCTNPELIQGKHVLLVDDVLTTGATLETAAKALKLAGAARVSAVVFAQA